jgi:hypothetical protein
MQTKSCSRCGARAEYSICSVVSTLGVKPRVQQSTESVLFCGACLHDSKMRDGVSPSLGVEQRVYVALSAIEQHSAQISHREIAVSTDSGVDSASRSDARFLSLINKRLIETQ